MRRPHAGHLQDSYFDAVPRFALRAGPRATIYYQPEVLSAACHTCHPLDARACARVALGYPCFDRCPERSTV